ncbi:MAG: AAA family ATPase [Desulfobulbaceae bacterium]|nr:AAA family ATPase [Desulfobulbaceae bacterium]
MNYLSLLDLDKEPFSTSPDPDFFFASDQHMRSLQRLELAIRLRKGLSVALGEVGTGKTTLCRRLIRRLDKGGGQVSVHLFLDPEFTSGAEFLRAIAVAFGLGEPGHDATERELKETVKQHLFAQGVDDQKITVLIIDEGQKLPGFCLEILREFLNFETNQHKLLQIVIFAQLEFRQALRERANFSDRIAELCTLTPLNFADTRRMILFRLRQAHGRKSAPRLFSFWALLAVYRQTGGYPRKIVQLCSQALLALIVQNKNKVTASLVRACHGRLAGHVPQPSLLRPALLVILLAVVLFWQWEQLYPVAANKVGQSVAAVIATSAGSSPSRESRVRVASNFDEEPVLAPIREEDPGVVREKPPEPLPQIAGEGAKTDAASLAPIIYADPGLFTARPVLGMLRVAEGDSLSRMMKRIYGDCNKDLLQMVVAANPQIADPDLIPVNAVVSFPAFGRPCGRDCAKGYRLLFRQEETLADADRVLKDCFRSGVQVCLVPVWQAQRGVQFLIMTPETYPEPEKALAALRDLPLDIAGRASILHDWEGAYLFFPPWGERPAEHQI